MSFHHWTPQPHCQYLRTSSHKAYLLWGWCVHSSGDLSYFLVVIILRHRQCQVSPGGGLRHQVITSLVCLNPWSNSPSWFLSGLLQPLRGCLVTRGNSRGHFLQAMGRAEHSTSMSLLYLLQLIFILTLILLPPVCVRSDECLVYLQCMHHVTDGRTHVLWRNTRWCCLRVFPRHFVAAFWFGTVVLVKWWKQWKIELWPLCLSWYLSSHMM